MLKRFKLLLSVFLFFSVAAVFAQTSEDSDWFWGKTVSEISFEGLRSVKKSEVSGVTNSFIGKVFDEKFYSDILDRLYALGYFEDIEPFAKHDAKNPESKPCVYGKGARCCRIA
ncbi:MAG: hypothetical protein L6V86_06535 [Treponema sp.]|nr:MAG: hypothetical protein L6V86_06535 [Treponema sp.]